MARAGATSFDVEDAGPAPDRKPSRARWAVVGVAGVAVLGGAGFAIYKVASGKPAEDTSGPVGSEAEATVAGHAKFEDCTQGLQKEDKDGYSRCKLAAHATSSPEMAVALSRAMAAAVSMSTEGRGGLAGGNGTCTATETEAWSVQHHECQSVSTKPVHENASSEVKAAATILTAKRDATPEEAAALEPFLQQASCAAVRCWKPAACMSDEAKAAMDKYRAASAGPCEVLLAVAGPQPQSPTYDPVDYDKHRRNALEFDTSWGYVTRFELDSHVAAGEFDDVEAIQAGLIVNSERRLGPEAAAAFNKDLRPEQMISSYVTRFGDQGEVDVQVGDRMPEELNFMVEGKLQVLIVGEQEISCPVRIGQGHFLLTNNWWIGGPGCIVHDELLNFITCKCDKGVVKFTPLFLFTHRFLMSASSGYEDNVIEFTGDGGIATVDWTMDSYKASTYFDSVSSVRNQLHCKFGHLNKQTPALFFNQNLDGNRMIADRPVNDHQPSKLSFAMKGTLTITVGDQKLTCPDMRFGQGDNTFRNWWVAGKACQVHSSQTRLQCTCNEGELSIDKDNLSSYRFKVAVVINQAAVVV